MAFSAQGDSMMSEINVTPFVDVMLVLLIIFMVAAPMMIQGANVALPEAELGVLPATDKRLIISMDKDANIYINDYKIGVDWLKEKLIKIFEGRKDREVFLKADKRIPYGIVVKVMAEIKGAGATKLGIITESSSEEDDGKK